MKLRDLLRGGKPKKPRIPPLGAPAARAWTSPSNTLRRLGPSPSILVVKLDHIGDFITALPAVKRLQAAFPTSTVSLLCAPFVADLARSTGLFAAVYSFDFFGARMQEPRFANADDVSELRAMGLPAHDIVIDLRQEDEARALLWGLDAKVRAGFGDPVNPFPLDIALPEMERCMRRKPWPAMTHSSTRLVLLVEALVHARDMGVETVRFATASVPVGETQNCVILAPGTRLGIKGWTAEGWLGLASAVVERTNLDIAVIGRGEEAETAAQMAKLLPQGRLRDFVGQVDLADLPALMAPAAAFVGVDTGTTHLAASLGVPTVALFSGFADIRVWAPIGPATVVVHAGAGCAPCGLPSETLCPYQRRCMSVIDPEAVLSAMSGVAAHPELKGLRAAPQPELVFAAS
ncbi:glycosyltransferase family 9 protein [Xanthobacter oligotrophicus]|uniref:glycosyltransferase family 9 protein n=1 Tax=Xanthobacter oligotrophicus TaxID=2607286 RepID=UPI0011F0D0C7|nr:glycosyltransferase family 9 protein [Xanthobacter oligotrophicus]MCG5234254.1 glycosyltransferase family 9 protein [Xanthobacter oligotrophicus]